MPVYGLRQDHSTRVRLAGRFIRGEPRRTTSGPTRRPQDWSLPSPAVGHDQGLRRSPVSADIELQDALELAVTHSTEWHATIKIRRYLRGREDARGGRRHDRTGHQGRQSDQGHRCRSARPLPKTRSGPGRSNARWSRHRPRNRPCRRRCREGGVRAAARHRSPKEAMAEGALQIHDQWPNLCFAQPQIKGDAARRLATSAHG